MAAVGVAVACVVPAVGPAYRAATRWQAGNILSQAEELVRQQMFPEAIERLNTALRLDPRSTQALRTLAEIYSRFELPYALPVWRALLSLPDHSEADVHGYIDLALALQRFDLAEAELSRLLARAPVSVQTRIQAIEFFLRQGDPGRALSFAEDLRQADPTNRTHHLRAARILLSSPDPARQREGLGRLAGLRDLSARERWIVLQSLVDAGPPPGEETRQFLDRFVIPEDAPPTEFLLWSDARIRVAPSDRPAILEAAIARYRSGPPAARAELGAWLNRVGAHAALVSAFRLEEAAEYPPLLSSYLLAMARERRWEALRQACAGPLSIDGWLLEGFRAATAQALGQDALAREHWRRAFGHAEGHAGRLRALGDLALQLGATDQAVEAFNGLTRDRLHRLAGYRRLASVFERIGDTQRLRTVMREWSAHVPDDPVPENAFCYLSGLLRQEVELAAERALRLHERLPRRLTYRATLALLELRRGQASAALQRLRRVPLDLAAAGVQTRLIVAAVYAANGQETSAREVVKDLDPARLLPEEREWLRQLQRGE